MKRLRRVPPHVFESETDVNRNEICPRELWLLNGYAEYRRTFLISELNPDEMAMRRCLNRKCMLNSSRSLVAYNLVLSDFNFVALNARIPKPEFLQLANVNFVQGSVGC